MSTPSAVLSRSRLLLEGPYWRWGYLLPCGLPLAHVLGRAVFTGLLALYWLWSLLVCRLPRQFDRRLLWVFATLLMAFALGIPTALDPLRGIREWLKFAAEASVWMFAYAAIERVPGGLERLVRTLGFATIAMLGVLYVKLLWQLPSPDFSPTRMLQEDGLAFLTPFALYTLLRTGGRAGRWGAALCLGAAGYYILLAQGRAALVGLAAAVFVFTWLAEGWRARTALAVTVVLFAAAVMTQGDVLLRGAASRDTLSGATDQLSAGRTAIWRQALASPPRQLFVGVGLGNTALHERILTVDRGPERAPIVVKHLHNFVLDCWYETGLIGVGAVFLWLGVFFARGALRWRVAAARGRAAAGTLLAGSFAIIAAGLFSFSYLSKPFAVYLPLFLGALVARRPDR
jgi:teichuronic acid biosynthesis protein TuaE